MTLLIQALKHSQKFTRVKLLIGIKTVLNLKISIQINFNIVNSSSEAFNNLISPLIKKMQINL